MSSSTQTGSYAGFPDSPVKGRMHGEGIALLKDYFYTKSQRPTMSERQQLLERLRSMPGQAYLQPKHIHAWFARQRTRQGAAHSAPGRPRAPIDRKTREFITNAVEGQSLQKALESVSLCSKMFKLDPELITSFITSLYHPVVSQTSLPTPEPEHLAGKQAHRNDYDEDSGDEDVGSDIEVDSDADEDHPPRSRPEPSAPETIHRLPTPVSPVFSTRVPPSHRPATAAHGPKRDSTATQVLLEIDKEINLREPTRPPVTRMSAQELQANWDARKGRMASLLATLSR
ncbi:hypothetical protein CYLTODRAFT_487361 [Cylindrobasidium torrendii FP15055 ss-10]|uniref:Homeobox domain-containing protein n=1 Tax=Cylindrobasidium torrendii FP15055 ss-10 TaxID=1314674 RepID=A0A0D7BLI3_9AGAR|nr:hypothetical protein CYLTODRAFT_487361 [Cylindrobasidium torrendii FP15055 ss-10]